ncbi:alkaline phosphatase-like protein [Rhizoclosmatium globosum]|uniref:Alkaline phosphatase-like protein n=1 Tax=Rhizoclosmatium globosum TaxID=329046 RepID=A0A1Y2CQZ9_9FUNG|nr:alkaline phosphatase-like protein [Rhizoclosmatium globosum]|eukprot:ORY49470.1 alkaline phosphatase-like protein [Rhizoclosmatium globosum]
MNLALLLVALTTSYSVQAGSCFSGPILPPTVQGSSSSGRNATSQSNTHIQLDIKITFGVVGVYAICQEHLIEKGTVFENHFVTSAICCPSRVSVLKGQFAHNTGFTDVFGLLLLNGYGVHNKEQIPKGWTEFDALVHPYIYDNFHPVFAKNGVISDYEGHFQLISRSSSGALKTVDEKPFFLYLAPTAPHTEVLFNSQSKVEQIPGEKPYTPQIKFTEAVPASRHAELFPNVKIPRRENFNTADLRLWITGTVNACGLSVCDELLDSVVNAVEAAGQGDNTFIFYSSDNGGPGVPREQCLAGAQNKAYAFDGSPIPIFAQDAPQPNRESFALFPIANGNENIYRSVRLVSDKYSYLYTVWCTDHHELYDLKKDPQQLVNVYKSSPVSLINRLDALLVVLKDCVGKECQSPWTKLHSDGSVKNFGQALDAKYDGLYQKTERLVISECLNGFFPANEKLVPALHAHEE